MDMPIDEKRLGHARCDRVGPRSAWDFDAGKFSDEQAVDRASGMFEWEGEFSVLGGSLRVSWSAETLNVEKGNVVSFVGLTARESKSGRWFFSASRVDAAKA